MKKFKILISFYIILLFLNSCGAIKKGFENPKKNSSDEFLVEKKSPLSMPPNYKELPVPKTLQNQSENDDKKIKSLITNNDNTEDQNTKKSNKQTQDFEQTIIEKIKQN